MGHNGILMGYTMFIYTYVCIYIYIYLCIWVPISCFGECCGLKTFGDQTRMSAWVPDALREVRLGPIALLAARGSFSLALGSF